MYSPSVITVCYCNMVSQSLTNSVTQSLKTAYKTAVPPQYMQLAELSTPAR